MDASLPVVIGRADRAPQALALLGEILPVYREVYAEPPYFEGPAELVEFADRYRRQTSQRPGASVAVARSAGAAVGFAYGFLLPAGSGWWDGAPGPLPEELTREDGSRTFALCELAVRPPWRRRGVARRLHEELLAGLDAERSLLTVRPEPEAAPAQAAYAAWGYRTVTLVRPGGEGPAYDLMIRPL